MGNSGHACGKAIVLGEHAVVYGVPAIAVGIDRGASAQAVPIEHGPSRLYVRGWGVSTHEDEDHHDLARAFRALLASARSEVASLAHYAVDVDAHLPPGGGLGCSAAMGVAIARALEPRLGENAVQERAMAWERVFHGNPSGVDAAVAARGGCVVFRKGAGLEPIRVRGALHLCIGSTGTASSTKAMVEGVARMRSENASHVDSSFDEIRALVASGCQALEAGDRPLLGRLMDRNQAILGRLLVSTPAIELMCRLARQAGALGAKLTGAGGGGSVIALVSSPAAAEAVVSSWKGAKFDGFGACVATDIRVRAFESENAP